MKRLWLCPLLYVRGLTMTLKRLLISSMTRKISTRPLSSAFVILVKSLPQILSRPKSRRNSGRYTILVYIAPTDTIWRLSMKSTSQHVFSRVPSVSLPRSSFRRDRTYKSAFDCDYLVPFYIDEVLPGDTFNLKLNAFARLSTPIVPFMDNLYLDFFFFFVPCRLVWDNWERFNGAQDNPGDSTDFVIPQYSSGDSGFSVGGLADYFGLPVNVASLDVSALPFRAYNLIWNEFFRDENFQDSLPVYKNDGPDPLTDADGNYVYVLRPRGKRKDYFTSALPSPQKGPGVEVPLGGSAPVYNTSEIDGAFSDFFIPEFKWTTGTTWGNPYDRQLMVKDGKLTSTGSTAPTALNGNLGLALSADLSSASLVTINSLRQAFQVQRLLERDNLGGTRYFEILVSHFGVRSPDSRLQRPEYLGGGTAPMNIHTVAQTSATSSVSPQGNLAAIGVAGVNKIGFQKSFVEHGYIIGLVNVRADLTYQQGVDRLWSRSTRFDFYWPALAHLGEQAVLNKEIYAQGGSVHDADGNLVDNQVFGYQERWAEYRYGVNKITGKLRSGVTGSLDVWHLAQNFTSLPMLNEEFIRQRTPLKRVLAVQTEPQVIFDSVISVNCVRPMPVYSVPGLIDHF